MMRVFLSFQLALNTVNSLLQNRGNWNFQIQKTGVNMQSLKNRGKRAIGPQNKGSYAIGPCIYCVLINAMMLSSRVDFI